MIIVNVPLPIVVTQWTLLAGLSLLVIIMYRQLAHMMLLARAGSNEGGLGIGESVEPFGYWIGSSDELRVFDIDDRPTAVMLSDPLCSRCGDALLELDRFATTATAEGLRILVLTETDADLFDSASMFRTSSLEIGRLAPGDSMRVFRTRVTPFMFVLDEVHTVLVKGAISSEGELERLVKESTRTLVIDQAPSGIEGTQRVSSHGGRRG